MRLSSTLQSMRRSTRSEHHTSTTHRQGRAVASSSSSSNDNDDGGEEDVAGASRAAGGDDVDWDTIQEDEEWVFVFLIFFSFWCFMPKGEKLERGQQLFRRHGEEIAAARASCFYSFGVDFVRLRVWETIQNSIYVIMLPKYFICVGYGHELICDVACDNIMLECTSLYMLHVVWCMFLSVLLQQVQQCRNLER